MQYAKRWECSVDRSLKRCWGWVPPRWESISNSGSPLPAFLLPFFDASHPDSELEWRESSNATPSWSSDFVVLDSVVRFVIILML